MKNMNNGIKSLLSELIGTKNTLSNNILFIDFTGSHEKAQLLSQMWYWSSRTKIKGGWFCKTHAEWFDEIRVKSHSIRRFTQEFCKLGFLESKLKKFDGVPKPHYRLDTDELIRQLVTFCEGNKLSTSQIVTLEPDKLLPSIEGDTELPSINIDLSHRLNTESKEHAPAKTENQQPLFVTCRDHIATQLKGEYSNLLRGARERSGYRGKMTEIIEDYCRNIAEGKIEGKGDFHLMPPKDGNEHWKWLNRMLAGIERYMKHAARRQTESAPTVKAPAPPNLSTKTSRASADAARKIAGL